MEKDRIIYEVFVFFCLNVEEKVVNYSGFC